MKTTNKTHTPTPWHFAPGELVYGPKGEAVASCRFVTNFKEENVENVRLIVRAVNSHEALLEAAKNALPELRNYVGEVKGRTVRAGLAIQQIADELEKAIRSAEGKYL